MFSLDPAGNGSRRNLIVAELEKPGDEERKIGLREIELWVGMTWEAKA
jgi:hypothetical protein